MKLALFALVLGLGACVADESTTDRVGTDDVGDISVADSVEIPTYDADEVDLAIVTITGLEIPGRMPTTDHIDFTNVEMAEKDPQVRKLCALADQLPNSDVCSSLCDPAGFSARLFDQGSPGGCKQTQCSLPGDTVVNLDICTSSN